MTDRRRGRLAVAGLFVIVLGFAAALLAIPSVRTTIRVRWIARGLHADTREARDGARLALEQASALTQLGIVQWLAGDYPAATASLTRALVLFCDLSDRFGQADALAQLGTVQQETGASFLTRMNATISGLVPNWEQLNKDPSFTQWTRTPSGRSRKASRSRAG